MATIQAAKIINDVKIVKLATFADSRGRFMETFRTEWFPDRDWQVVQTNRSESDAGVLRGLHYHRHQVDYWHVTMGSVLVALADLRRSSSTFRKTEIFKLDQNSPAGLYIPIGVAHGFLAQTKATLTYVVDNYYDGNDEFGVAWDDPDFNIDWGHDAPNLSDRDRDNPHFAMIAQEDLPE